MLVDQTAGSEAKRDGRREKTEEWGCALKKKVSVQIALVATAQSVYKIFGQLQTDASEVSG